MSAPADQIVTSRERLQRIIDSLALLSVNELDPSKTGITIEQEDDFALLEQTVNVFASELLESQSAKSQYLQQKRLIRAVATDTGTGIPNLDHILSGAYKSKTGMGLGLLGTKRLADKFNIHSGPLGTSVEFEVWL